MLYGLNTNKIEHFTNFKSNAATLKNITQICTPIFMEPLTNIITFTMLGV